MIKFILNVWYLFLRLILRKNIFIHNSAKIYFPRIITKNNGSIVIEDNVRMEQRNHLETSNESKIQFKYNSSTNYNCQFYGDIYIGEYCILASEVYMSSFNHDFKSNPAIPIKFADKSFSKISKPIYIENDVWIGKNTFIGPGVYIAKGCVIGANLKITKSIYDPFTIVYNDYPFLTKKRFLLAKKGSITAVINCLPYFYRGFKYLLKNEEVISIKGKNVYFLVPFDHDIGKINIQLENTLVNVIRINCNKNLNIYYNNTNLSCGNITDVNLLSLALHLKMNIINISYSKSIEFKNLNITP